MAATIAAQEGRIAELAAQVAALTGQIALLQRDPQRLALGTAQGGRRQFRRQ